MNQALVLCETVILKHSGRDRLIVSSSLLARICPPFQEED